MEFAGEDTVKTLLMSDSIVQPFIAGIIGFIPNCAASVVFTQLYIEGVVKFVFTLQVFALEQALDCWCFSRQTGTT